MENNTQDKQKRNAQSILSVIAKRESQRFTKQDMRNQISRIIKQHQHAIYNKLDLSEFGGRTSINYPDWWQSKRLYATKETENSEKEQLTLLLNFKQSLNLSKYK